jgi:ABC-2 type transport system ATP-binding protein
MYAIETESLTKRYGRRRGITDISLQVPEGMLFGFIGPNGAGKTTTIRTLLGLLRPTSGRARILGRDAVGEGPAARQGVGYVPGETHFYDELHVAELLAYFGRYHPGDHARRRAELVETFDLDLRARVRDLSLGNRKKVALVVALQTRPRLVLLDEPTGGLDPVIQSRLFELLGDEVRGGTTVFFSSHVLSEVQRVCRTVAVVNEGRLVAVEDVETLRAHQLHRVHAAWSETAPDLSRLVELPGVDRVERDGRMVSFVYGGPMPALLEALAAIRPTDVRIEEPSLEEIFLRHYVAGGADDAPRA